MQHEDVPVSALREGNLLWQEHSTRVETTGSCVQKTWSSVPFPLPIGRP